MATGDKQETVWMVLGARDHNGKQLKARTRQEVPDWMARRLYQAKKAVPYDGQDGDTDAGDQDDEKPRLPEGYSAKQFGAYYELRSPDGEIVPGPSNGKWQGWDGVVAAAEDHELHAAEQQEGSTEGEEDEASEESEEPGDAEGAEDEASEE